MEDGVGLGPQAQGGRMQHRGLGHDMGVSHTGRRARVRSGVLILFFGAALLMGGAVGGAAGAGAPGADGLVGPVLTGIARPAPPAGRDLPAYGQVLTAVSCASPSDCWATGAYAPQGRPNSSMRRCTGTERNGRTYATPQPGGSVAGDLNGLVRRVLRLGLQVLRRGRVRHAEAGKPEERGAWLER